MTERHTSKIDLHALLAQMGKEGRSLLEREIIAPLLPNGKIRTRLNGMVYELKPRGDFVGWGRFRPLNEREAEPISELLPWERGAYLEVFPALRMILLWPDAQQQRAGMWWALAFNTSDAQQWFDFAAEPLPVFLCDPTDGAERFERVIVRVDGYMLWYDGPDTLADPTHAEWLRNTATHLDEMDGFLAGLASSERQALIFWHIRQLEQAMETEVQRRRQVIVQPQKRKQQEWLQQQMAHSILEERLRYALAKADATLHSYSEIPSTRGNADQLVVEWSENGQRRRYRSTINAQFTVVSSGICLSGQDRDFDLTSLVHVMTQSPWHRYEGENL